jgi:hypothetical protein
MIAQFTFLASLLTGCAKSTHARKLDDEGLSTEGEG